ncbi:mucin-20 isoform X2 [Sapajus apella]|uniref:Mucin-20 isoform X2 n=1 Tax=Sapajus apella TaxID=9515 RepID=A0A6J3GQL5_SAPAP|nr:mucin-20 isoform X2 [Sapajus apella]
MGSLWGLLLPLFFFCWEAGVSGSAAGPGTGRPETAVTADATEGPAMTPGAGTSSEGALQTPGLTETSAPSHAASETHTLSTETSSRTSVPASPIPVAETRGIKTISPATETRIVTKIIPPDVVVVIATSMETSVTSGSPEGAGTTTLETVTGGDPEDPVFDTLCTDDSSEEAKTLTVALLPLAHASAEAEGLSSGSSASSHSSQPVITTSWTRASDVTVLTEALVTVTHMEVINCSITEIETATSIIPGASDTDHVPTAAVKASPTSHLPALPDSTATEPHVTEATASAETPSTAGATESATPDATVKTLLPTSSAAEREVTAPRALTLGETLATVSGKPLEEPSALSAETPSYVRGSGAASVSTEAGSAVDKTMSFAGASASAHSPSAAATPQNLTPSETTTDFTATGPFPASRDPLPSAHLTTASSSPGTSSTSAKTPMEPPTATSPTARTGQTTNVSPGENVGFLLLRLSVASLEDLTDPRVADSLVQQVRRELHAHVPLLQVSLLRVRRG